jgi:hypothetical protein
MQWGSRSGRRAALLALVVAVILGAAYWAYTDLRANYPYRSAIQLDGVAMTGGGAGWAVGNIAGKPTTMLMRADAGRWTILPKPAGLDDTASLQAVAMTSPQDGWLIAQNPLWKHDRYNTFIPGSTLLRYQNGQWRIASQSFPQQLWSLTLRTASDGWAVGSDGAIIHWDGVQWSQTPLPADLALSGSYLDAIAAPAATEAWAAGLGGAMFRWDGSSWRDVDLAAQLVAHSPRSVDAAPFAPHITGLAMTAPGQGWAIGIGQAQNGQAVGEILACSGGQWRIAQLVPGVEPQSIAISPRGAGWIVGDNGAILRLQGGQWRQQDSPTRDPLRNVSIAPDGQTWAVGWGGRLLREQHGAWSLVGDVTWSQAATESYS